MAHRKAGGSAKNLRDSNAQYLGVKLSDGQKAKTGNVIVRQRGIKILPGKNVKVAKDDSLFSMINGKVSFTSKRKLNFDGKIEVRKVVNVIPYEVVTA